MLHWLLIQWQEHEEVYRKGTQEAGEKVLKEQKVESMLLRLTKGMLLCDLVVKLMVAGTIQSVSHNPSSKQICSQNKQEKLSLCAMVTHIK